MKYIKQYESIGETITFNFSDLAKMESRKSEPLGYKDRYGKDDPNNEYNYFSTSKIISIYINNILTGGLIIDERGFNTLRKSRTNDDISAASKTATNQIANYLIKCHEQMKLSNPLYGNYDISGNDYRNQGRLPLFVHKFFEYIEEDFTHQTARVQTIKKMLKQLPIKLAAEKYNL